MGIKQTAICMRQQRKGIDETLETLREAGTPALVPFVTVGFPNIDTSIDLAAAVVEEGADMLELGVPFSDPLADGPTIQMTSQRALEAGVTLAACIEAVRELRARGIDVPLIFMGYYNPFLKRGLEQFTQEAADAGVNGLIVPDLPTEESHHLRGLCREEGMSLIPLLAPTSTDRRIEHACKGADGFIYCVGLTGVTGARSALSSGLRDQVERIRRYTTLPTLVGFGVSRREHVENIAQFADGAVVASALLDVVDKAPEGQAVAHARLFVSRLRGRQE